MSDEDVAPSRAEVDAWLWVYKHHTADQTLLHADMETWLTERGVSANGVNLIIGDLHTYDNYPVGADSGEDGGAATSNV